MEKDKDGIWVVSKEEAEVLNETCPICGGELITIAGYTMPNFCRRCDRFIFTSEILESKEDDWLDADQPFKRGRKK